jgi:hypothetical protein
MKIEHNPHYHGRDKTIPRYGLAFIFYLFNVFFLTNCQGDSVLKILRLRYVIYSAVHTTHHQALGSNLNQLAI